MSYCLKCGTQLPSEAGFCFKCGQRVGNPSEPPRASSPPAVEKTLATFRTKKGNQMTVTNQRISWSDGSVLNLDNINSVGVHKVDRKTWALDLYRKSDGENEGTGFDNEGECTRAQALIERALQEHRAAHPELSPPVEYKEVRVPLNIKAKTSAGHGITPEVAARNAAIKAGSFANTAITNMIQQEGLSRWVPEGSTDLLSLFLAGRVDYRHTGGVLLTWEFTFDSAKVRLRRTN